MNILTLENISKTYGYKPLLENVSFGISQGEKIGLVGVNGTGKSTLLKIIAGIEQPDTGTVTKNNRIRIEYLSQTPECDGEATVLEQIFKGDSYGMPVLREYEATLEEIAAGDISKNERLLELQGHIDRLDLWELESEAKAILTKLGIHDFNKKMGTLSGGQRKRVALASALITPCEFLILDEPTNHMDSESIQWLETYLNNRKGSLLMITHDRYFLDRVTNRIVEIDKGNLYAYDGNYSMYIEKKLERENLEKNLQVKRANLFRNELSWIKRGARARSTKQKARIDRFEDLKSTMQVEKEEKLELSVFGTRLGKKIIEIDAVSKAYDNQVLINHYTYHLVKEDRIGIIGPNGIGKSTLMKMIAGELIPDKGKIEIGETVKIGFFSQENDAMDDNMRVIDYITEIAEYLPLESGEHITASKMLERFLFSSEAQYNRIGNLSGGEKRRLYLLRILMSSPNVLLLDEPTNDFDTMTLTIIEDFLDHFNGPIITVSHDRYFLDRICNQMFVYKGDGVIERHGGNFTRYMEKLEEGTAEMEETHHHHKKKREKEPLTQKQQQKNSRKKFTYNEQREYDEIDSIIENLEQCLMELDEEIEKNATMYTVVQELLEKKGCVEKELEEKYERWTYLNELAEEIRESKDKNKK